MKNTKNKPDNNHKIRVNIAPKKLQGRKGIQTDQKHDIGHAFWQLLPLQTLTYLTN